MQTGLHKCRKPIPFDGGDKRGRLSYREEKTMKSERRHELKQNELAQKVDGWLQARAAPIRWLMLLNRSPLYMLY